MDNLDFRLPESVLIQVIEVTLRLEIKIIIQNFSLSPVIMIRGENTTTVAPPQPKPRLAEVKTKKKSNSVRQTQGSVSLIIPLLQAVDFHTHCLIPKRWILDVCIFYKILLVV